MAMNSATINKNYHLSSEITEPKKDNISSIYYLVIEIYLHSNNEIWYYKFIWTCLCYFEWVISIFIYSIFSYPVPEGKSGQQVVDILQKQVELLGAVRSGNFCVDCETYQSNSQNG
jgi:hypothetical protein